ncbi:Imm27 family immunity protein [Cellvibrio mixtus]|uniref:Imm27 family immunity protein n=1 Tax=Cellvibrio mixtus TaxID=39650 RepID=UPI000694CB35|nr:Imm27 family immunity protein [Cellvibrio mixtus]
MIEKLKNTENFLEGAWVLENGKIVEDSVSKRIQLLITAFLKKVAVSDDGWDTLYIDTDDSRYWELTYPESNLQGGGAPALKNIAYDEAEKKYSL